MIVELPLETEKQLQDLAAQQGRQVAVILEDALRRYIESLASSDLDSSAVGEGQMRLIPELPGLPAWNAVEA